MQLFPANDVISIMSYVVLKYSKGQAVMINILIHTLGLVTQHFQICAQLKTQLMFFLSVLFQVEGLFN